MLTDAQKTDVRRFLNFPLFGGTPTQAFGHRFYQWYGTLEFRMNNMQAAEETVVVDMLTNLTTLENDLFSVRANADTQQAAVWTRNPNEFNERKRIFMFWQERLAKFFGIPEGLFGGSNSIELVV